MRDCFGRNIDYLRISVTDRCNLRCVYCMPDEGVPALAHDQILTYEEIIEVAAVAKGLGIKHIRITGGEPLVRNNVISLVRGLKALDFPDISMTTNGVLLPPLSRELKDAGLNRVNISLDTLDPDKFSEITRRGKLKDALAGIQSALRAGLDPVKINTVITGDNFDEIRNIAALTRKWPVHVRFIEVMPIGPDQLPAHTGMVPVDAVIAETSKLGHLLPLPASVSNRHSPDTSAAGETSASGGPEGTRTTVDQGSDMAFEPELVQLRSPGPARTFKLSGARGTIGFIGAISHPFCSSCNRLRLTADGKLRPCLASDHEIDLMPVLRQAMQGQETAKQVTPGQTQTSHFLEPEYLKYHQETISAKGLEDAFRLALSLKPQGHDLTENHGHARRMCQIGG
jgi:cyclic pyranopterin phosphate synthase